MKIILAIKKNNLIKNIKGLDKRHGIGYNDYC